MNKICDGDSIVIDGVELSYNEIKKILIEHIVFKRKLAFLETRLNNLKEEVGVSNE